MNLQEAKEIMVAQDKISEFVKHHMEHHCISIGFYAPAEAAVMDHTKDFTVYLQYNQEMDEIRIVGAAAGIKSKPEQ